MINWFYQVLIKSVFNFEIIHLEISNPTFSINVLLVPELNTNVRIVTTSGSGTGERHGTIQQYSDRLFKRPENRFIFSSNDDWLLQIRSVQFKPTKLHKPSHRLEGRLQQINNVWSRTQLSKGNSLNRTVNLRAHLVRLSFSYGDERSSEQQWILIINKFPAVYIG